jgi:hypothetical protein
MRYLTLTIIICFFALAKGEAQQFEASTAGAPKWYLIKVKGTGDNIDKVVTEIDGKAIGMPTEAGLAAKAKQFWRIEAVPNTTHYEIINKHSGRKLDVYYDDALGERIASVNETPSTRWTISLSGGYYSLRIVTQPQGGISGAGYLTQGGTSLNSALYFTKSYTVADAQFQFISIDMPILSNDDETAWFSIHNARSGLSDKCLTEVETTADVKLSLQEYTDNNFRQQWKLVSIPGSESPVNFINRATGHLISTTPVYGLYDYVRYADAETAGWTIDELGSNQYEVRAGSADMGKYWYAATGGQASAGYVKGASLNTGFAWKFQLRDEIIFNSIYIPEYDNKRILVKNKRIYVEGADQYRIYTIYGASVDKNRELPTGIYLVTIKNKATKILVK